MDNYNIERYEYHLKEIVETCIIYHSIIGTSNQLFKLTYKNHFNEELRFFILKSTEKL